MSLIQLDIKGISYSQSRSGAYALVLTEVNGTRTLPIVIGAFEAHSIAIGLENDIKPQRPLTHDLFVNFAKIFQITVKKVIIHKLIDGIFYSSLVCERNKEEIIVDSRTSDAVAIAIRFEAPIYTYENILDKAGIDLKITDLSQQEEEQAEEDLSDEDKEILQEIISDLEQALESSYENHSIEELERMMQTAIENEEYEKAAQIRDEINRRKKS